VYASCLLEPFSLFLFYFSFFFIVS